MLTKTKLHVYFFYNEYTKNKLNRIILKLKPWCKRDCKKVLRWRHGIWPGTQKHNSQSALEMYSHSDNKPLCLGTEVQSAGVSGDPSQWKAIKKGFPLLFWLCKWRKWDEQQDPPSFHSAGYPEKMPRTKGAVMAAAGVAFLLRHRPLVVCWRWRRQGCAGELTHSIYRPVSVWYTFCVLDTK